MDLYDAVDPANIPASAPAVLIYRDGRISRWSSAAIAQWDNKPHIDGTVLANDAYPWFDFESGNASLGAVADACWYRLRAGNWSVVYCSMLNVEPVSYALAGKGVRLRPAADWPQPGAYLHVAAPTAPLQAKVKDLPVVPIAVQDRWVGPYDVSTCYGTFPVVPAAPGLPAPALTARKLNAPVVCAVVNPTGLGYWLVAADGGVFALDGAPSVGDPVATMKLVRPIVHAIPGTNGRGLVLVGADGGMFSLGGAEGLPGLPSLGFSPAG